MQIPYSTNSKWQHGSLAEDLMIVPWITAASTVGTRSLALYCPCQQQPATARSTQPERANTVLKHQRSTKAVKQTINKTINKYSQ